MGLPFLKDQIIIISDTAGTFVSDFRLSHLILLVSIQYMYYYPLSFTEEKIEAQKVPAICPKFTS